jgi:hypothetical protein
VTDEETTAPTREEVLHSAVHALSAGVEKIRAGIREDSTEEERGAASAMLDKLHGGTTELLLAAHNAAAAIESVVGFVPKEEASDDSHDEG